MIFHRFSDSIFLTFWWFWGPQGGPRGSGKFYHRLLFEPFWPIWSPCRAQMPVWMWCLLIFHDFLMFFLLIFYWVLDWIQCFFVYLFCDGDDGGDQTANWKEKLNSLNPLWQRTNNPHKFQTINLIPNAMRKKQVFHSSSFLLKANIRPRLGNSNVGSFLGLITHFFGFISLFLLLRVVWNRNKSWRILVLMKQILHL